MHQSMLLFFDTYGQYPIVSDKSDEQGGSVLNVLGGVKWISGDPMYEYVGTLNPKLINFIEYFMGRKTVNDMILDPWGEPYHIAIDTNGDGITEIQLLYAEAEIIERVEAPFAIWSNGPNRKNELGRGDDIASWILT